MRNNKKQIKRYEEMLAANDLYFFDVEEFENIADYYFEVGKLNEAVNVVELAKGQHPLSPIFPIKHAQYLVSLNKMDQAAIELDFAESIDPFNEEILIVRANILSRHGKHKSAIQLLNSAIEKTEDPVDLFPLLAAEHQMDGNFKKAIHYLKLVLEEFPDDDVAMYNIAMCYDALEKPHTAISYFNQFINHNPYSELAWYHLGLMYDKLDMHEKAIESMEYALLVDENFTAAYYEIARIYEDKDDYERAIEQYMRSMEFDEPNGYIYFKIGHCYLHLHKSKQALRYLNRAVSIDKQLDEAYIEIAAIEIIEDNKQVALHNLSIALDLDPDNPDYLFTAIEIYDKANMALEMEKTYRKLLKLGFNEPDVYMDFAELLVDQDEVDDAIEILEEAAQLYPKNEELLLMAAGFSFAIAEYNHGCEFLRQAKKIDDTSFEKFTEIFPEMEEDKIISDILKRIKIEL